MLNETDIKTTPNTQKSLLHFRQILVPMKFKFLLVLVLFFIDILCYCQGVATFRNIDFSVVGGKLIITYDIINYKTNDKFNIIPEIYKASGEKINALSFTGDLKEVSGGSGKKITWDIGKDNIILDEDIYVVISGEIIGEHIVDKPVETQKVIREPIAVNQKGLKPVNRTACLFESLIFPGWGTSRLTLKNGHFVKGFLGYGALIGSVILGKMANDSYDSYKSAISSTDRDNYFDNANKNSTMSMILASGAAAIWSFDLISVLAVKNKTIGRSSAGISIKIGYSLALENTHQFTCKIKF